ncbi:MAG: hypothetical protein WC455_14685 [Dehalococcoidia bacterium]|jgi:hypothetical protein
MSTADKYREYLSNPALQPAIDTIKITTLQNENNRLTTRVLKLESELARYRESEQRGIVEIIVQRDMALERLALAEGLLMRWRCRFPQSSLYSLTTTFLHPEQGEQEKKE